VFVCVCTRAHAIDNIFYRYIYIYITLALSVFLGAWHFLSYYYFFPDEGGESRHSARFLQFHKKYTQPVAYQKGKSSNTWEVHTDS